jgi:hypothetical protein
VLLFDNYRMSPFPNRVFPSPFTLTFYAYLSFSPVVTTRVMKVRDGKKDEGQTKHVIQKRVRTSNPLPQHTIFSLPD